MDKKVWDALKASGKLVELIPKDLRGWEKPGFSWFNAKGIARDRAMNGNLARLLRRQTLEQLNELRAQA